MSKIQPFENVKILQRYVWPAGRCSVTSFRRSVTPQLAIAYTEASSHV